MEPFNFELYSRYHYQKGREQPRPLFCNCSKDGTACPICKRILVCCRNKNQLISQPVKPASKGAIFPTDRPDKVCMNLCWMLQKDGEEAVLMGLPNMANSVFPRWLRMNWTMREMEWTGAVMALNKISECNLPAVQLALLQHRDVLDALITMCCRPPLMFDSEKDISRFEKKYPDRKEQHRIFAPTRMLAQFLLNGSLELLARVCLKGAEAPRLRTAVSKRPKIHLIFELFFQLGDYAESGFLPREFLKDTPAKDQKDISMDIIEMLSELVVRLLEQNRFARAAYRSCADLVRRSVLKGAHESQLCGGKQMFIDWLNPDTPLVTPEDPDLPDVTPLKHIPRELPPLFDANGKPHQHAENEDCCDAATMMRMNPQQMHARSSAPDHLPPYCGFCKVRFDATGIQLKTCSRCKKFKYCSADCQKADWAVHKSECQA